MAFKLGQKPGNPVINAQNNNHNLIEGSNMSMMNRNSPQYKATLNKEPDASSIVGTNPREQLNKQLGIPKSTPPNANVQSIKDNVNTWKSSQAQEKARWNALTDDQKSAEQDKRLAEQQQVDRDLWQKNYYAGYGGITTGAANIALGSGEEGEVAGGFVPGVGEVIDAKNTIKDLKKGDYAGAAMNAAGFILPFVPGKAIKKLFGKADGPVPAPKPMPTSNPIINAQKQHIKRSNLDEFGTPRNFKEGVSPDQFGGSRPWDNQPMDDLKNVKVKADKLDEFTSANPDWNTNPDNFKFLGTKSGRDMIEFNSPAGNQTFYRSSGLGGKAGSAGSYVPFEGYQDLPGTKNWFMKEGSEGTFGGHPIKTIHLDKSHPRYKKGDRSISVRQQLEEMDVDPMDALRKGDLKLQKPGYDFNYTNNPDSKIHQIASGLEKIEKDIIYGPIVPR
jgi:hypothetical protein